MAVQKWPVSCDHLIGDMANYNPYILGFMEDAGRFDDLWMPLQEALQQFGDLPSRHGLLARGPGRRERKTLNLPLGIAVNRIFQQTPNLKRLIFSFFDRWHRDWPHEFGIDTLPLFNRHDAATVMAWLSAHRELLEQCQALSVREFLRSQRLIRTDVLNSIAEDDLLSKAITILQRKLRQPQQSANGVLMQQLDRLQNRLRLDRLTATIGRQAAAIGLQEARIYTDELVQGLSELVLPGAGRASIGGVTGEGIEFEYASRDAQLLALGSQIGDCTARPFQQLDAHTENIYWTIYPWLLDRNYLILKCHYQGNLVAKAHLLPLAAYESGGLNIFLAVDAVETSVAMRHDLPGEGKIPVAQCQQILQRLQQEILRIGDAMGVSDIHAELFSNNPLVRQWLETFERTYLDVTRLHKVDELEDLFEFACELSRQYQQPSPEHLFMEIQFRNTQLMSHQTPRHNIKGFAQLRSGRISGLAMNRVIGV